MSDNVASNRGPIKLSVRSLIEDLHNGITRCKDDHGYNATRGSIEEKYELTKKEVNDIFTHPALKGKKVRIPEEKRYELIDDTAEDDVTENTTTTATEEVEL